MTNFVYAIQCTRGIKLGVTNDLKKRVSTLNIGNTEDLCVMGAIKYDSREEAMRTEKELHKMFANKRVRGEWFDIRYEDVQEVYPNLEDVHYEPGNLKLYDSDGLQDMPTTTRDVFLAVAMFMSKQNSIRLDKDMKSTIATTIASAEQTVNNAINNLVKCGMLKRVGMAQYMVNPHVIVKTHWGEVKELQEVYTQ